MTMLRKYVIVSVFLSVTSTTTTSIAPTTTPILYNCSDNCLPPPFTTTPPCIKQSIQPSTTAVTTTLRPCMPNRSCSCNETDAICMNNTIGCNDTQAEDCDNSTTISTGPATEITTSILSSDSPSSSSANPTQPSMTEVALSTSAADTGTTMSLPLCPDVTEGPSLYSCDRLTGHCQYGCPYDLTGPYCNISCFGSKIYNCDKCGYDSSTNVPICKQCSRHFYQTSERKCAECGTNCANYNSTTSRCNHNDGTCNFGCTDKHYGLTCTLTCTSYCYPKLCDQMNGCCTKGCYFKQKCGCRCNEPCNSSCKNGVCNHECTCTDGCNPGFHGPKCNRPCSENCFSLNGSIDTCNSTNGHCYNGCVNDTFWTETCEQNCSDGCANGKCVQETGECIEGCKEPSLHGLDCSKKCSSTCLDQHCVRKDGICLLGCVDGWHGDFCEHPCAPNCLNRTCDRANESCTLGCTDGYFDRLCNRNCSFNCMNNICDFSTGFCTFGCVDCFIGDLCDEHKCRPGQYGQNCEDTCGHCIDGNTTCSVIDGTCPAGCKPGYSLADRTCKTGVNILRAPGFSVNTSQSSQYLDSDSSRAIDGLKGPDPETCNCCSQTQNAEVSWWQVDMGVVLPIGEIVLYGQNDNRYQQLLLSGFSVYLSTSVRFPDVPFLKARDDVVNATYHIDVMGNYARYVRIERNGVLIICEVEIFRSDKTCPPNTYTVYCIPCGHCYGGLPCDDITGRCPNGCGTGYSGDMCNQAVNTGTSYGTKDVIGAAIGGSIGGAIFILLIVMLVQRRNKLRCPWVCQTSQDYESPKPREKRDDQNMYDVLDIPDMSDQSVSGINPATPQYQNTNI